MRVVIKVVWVVALWSGLATAFGMLYLTTAAAILLNIAIAIVLLVLAFFLGRSQYKQPCKQQEKSHEENTVEEDVEDVDETIDPAMLQQWSRVELPSGGERIDAVMRVDFVTGQQTASLHLPLCPPFSQPLSWELSTLDAADAVLQVAKSLASGVRIDVKRKAGQPAASHWVLASGTETAE